MLLTTITDNKVHTFEYNKGDTFAIMDGERMELSFDEFVDPAKVTESLNSLISIQADDYTPVYLTTGRINFDKIVKNTSDVVTVIGGVISVAALVGANITKNELASIIGNWAGAVGFGSYVVGKTFSGQLTYDQYKTRGLVSTGYGTYLTALRNDNVRAIGTVAGFNMNLQLRATGNCFFNSKPY